MLKPITPRQVRFRTGDQALVREINLSLIMQRLFEHTSLSRAALAELTGLNKSTVSSLVQELQDMNFLREAGRLSGSVGRPSVMLELNPDAGVIISAELGVDYISVKCADFGANILREQHEPIEPNTPQDTILARVMALLHDAVAHSHHRTGHERLLGIALGVPGLVDQDTGDLLFAPNLRWKDVAIKRLLSVAFPGAPVFVENEANLAALGEYFYGAAKGYDDVLYISTGVGLGGAIVRRGQIVRGKSGFAAEFGHMTVDPNGELCNCGNRGCWETQVSQRALFQHIRAAVEAGQASALVAMIGGALDRLTLPVIVDAAHAGDSVAQAAITTVGRSLGIGIASLINALNPDLVVLGGMFSLAGDLILPLIEAEIAQRALPWHAAATTVMLAKHGANACVIGGIATVFQHILMAPATFRALVV